VSKKFTGKLCVYCAEASSTTADHVFAREFFLSRNRNGIPKVPACHPCNRDKADLEHYLTTILPFGGRHPDALENLETMVPKRLQKNAKLHQKLLESRGTRWSQFGALLTPSSTLPIDSGRFERLFQFVVRGLIWHHWKVYLTSPNIVEVATPTEVGARFFDKFFGLDKCERVRASIGDGTFVYEGVHDVRCPEITAWRIWMYGGLHLAEGNEPEEEVSSQINIVTRPPDDAR